MEDSERGGGEWERKRKDVLEGGWRRGNLVY